MPSNGIKPGHPQQNGRHERMHLTLKKETTRPPGSNSLQQQERFDAFVRRPSDVIFTLRNLLITRPYVMSFGDGMSSF